MVLSRLKCRLFYFTFFNTTVGTIWHQIVWFWVEYCFKDQLPVFSVCVLVVIWDCLGATGEVWAVLGLPWLQRNLFLAAVRWIGPVSQFRPCMPNTDPLITPHKVSHSLSLWLLPLRLALSYSSFHRTIITRIVPCLRPLPVFCSPCPLHHSVHPALPPTWLFLPCLARNHPADGFWMGRQCLHLSVYSFRV